MKDFSVLLLAALFTATHAVAEVPDVMLEACSLLDTPNKRVECLRAANSRSGPSAAYSAPVQSFMAIPANRARASRTSNVQSAAAPSYGAANGTCHVGPRGGTYTITKSGRKNYGGC